MIQKSTPHPYLTWTLLFALGPLTAAGSFAAEKEAGAAAALESIRAAELHAHVDWLADDAREGRDAGSEGGRAAADYLAKELADLGLLGAGVDGGFFQPFGEGYRNVLGRLEGSDPNRKQQYILIGAHYDHIGYGNKGNSRGTEGKIHNGADDNASGTSGVVELAEAFTMLGEPPGRSLLFVFWDAEEKGLLGSKHWAEHPTLPLEQVVAVFNLDMIGRLRDDRLTVFGSRTAAGFRRLVSRNNDDLRLDFPRGVLPNTDHHPFFRKEIPVLFAHTGVHDQYHCEGDDTELINAAGMRRVVRLLFGVAHELAQSETVPAFRRASRSEPRQKPDFSASAGTTPVRLGVVWRTNEEDGSGVLVSSVHPDSPAARAGLAAGDRIVKLGEQAIGSGENLIWAVAAASSPVAITLHRGDARQPVEISVELKGRPKRLGITWTVDDAEPATPIVTSVVPGSPATLAGLRPGDRIHRLAGRDLLDTKGFAKRVQACAGEVEIIVEREGRLEPIVVRLPEAPSATATNEA